MTPLVRTLLLGFSVLALAIGVGMAVVWLRNGSAKPSAAAVLTGVNVLVAAKPIPSGSLLRADSMAWRHIPASKAPEASFAQGSTSDVELIGSVARKNIDAGALLVPADLVRPGEKDFLAAAVTPGYRAVTIPIDVQQSASGLVLPGDRVDVILVRQIADGSASGKASGETILRGARVIAVGHALRAPPKTGAQGGLNNIAAADAPPKTISLEARPADAERLFTSAQLGRLELALRPIGEPAAEPSTPAIPNLGTASTVARPAIHRRTVTARGRPADQPPPPVLILRGSKGGAS